MIHLVFPVSNNCAGEVPPTREQVVPTQDLAAQARLVGEKANCIALETIRTPSVEPALRWHVGAASINILMAVNDGPRRHARVFAEDSFVAIPRTPTEASTPRGTMTRLSTRRIP